MIELGFYENIIKLPTKKKKLLSRIIAAIIYVFAVIGWILLAIFSEFSLVSIFLVLLALSVAAFFIPTRLDFNADFEYSISDTYVTLAKIYGNTRRKSIFEAYSENILYIAPKTDDNIKKALEYNPRERYDVYYPDAKNIWLLVFKNEKEQAFLFVFEIEDSAVKLLKRLKPSAISFR